MVLFIDGIDIRPASVPYERYLDCVKGLANAVWSVNNDFFPSIRGSKGRLRVVLLLRPDIFNSLGLQNRNTKLRDNAVVLDWRTVYYSHRSSDLFKMADRLFSAQQDEILPIGASWDHYFPFNATNVRADENYATSFVALMRYSFHRPRDILTILDILREKYDDSTGNRVFEYKDLFTADFKRTYGDYLLGEIKDSLSFYYDEEEFELFLKFFEYLDGKQKFTYEQYADAFEKLTDFLGTQQKTKPGFMRTSQEFLQCLYDQNILCYVEHTVDERFIRWCFIERSPSNISPKVKIGLEYEIHYGLANVLNTGKEIASVGRNVLGNIEIAQQARRRGRRGKGAERLSLKPEEQQLGRGTPDTRPESAAEGIIGVEDQSGLVAEASSPSAFEVGIVKFFYPAKGYGFIIENNTKEDIHFRSAALEGAKMIRRGTRVEFVVTRDSDGRLTAIDVRRIAYRRSLA
jgi:cold shock CspA family protein